MAPSLAPPMPMGGIPLRPGTADTLFLGFGSLPHPPNIQQHVTGHLCSGLNYTGHTCLDLGHVW
jgi:hypothetical protein